MALEAVPAEDEATTAEDDDPTAGRDDGGGRVELLCVTAPLEDSVTAALEDCVTAALEDCVAAALDDCVTAALEDWATSMDDDATTVEEEEPGGALLGGLTVPLDASDDDAGLPTEDAPPTPLEACVSALLAGASAEDATVVLEALPRDSAPEDPGAPDVTPDPLACPEASADEDPPPPTLLPCALDPTVPPLVLPPCPAPPLDAPPSTPGLAAVLQPSVPVPSSAAVETTRDQ